MKCKKFVYGKPDLPVRGSLADVGVLGAPEEVLRRRRRRRQTPEEPVTLGAGQCAELESCEERNYNDASLKSATERRRMRRNNE